MHKNKRTNRGSNKPKRNSNKWINIAIVCSSSSYRHRRIIARSSHTAEEVKKKKKQSQKMFSIEMGKCVWWFLSFVISSTIWNFCARERTHTAHTCMHAIKEWCRSRELSSATLMMINSSVCRVQSQVEKVAHWATWRQSNCQIRVCKNSKKKERRRARETKYELRTVERCHFSAHRPAHSLLCGLVCARANLIDQTEFR